MPMKWFEDVRSILILACSNSRMIFKYKIGPEMSRPHQYKIGCFAKKTSTKNQSNQSKRCQAVQTPHWRDRHSAPGTRAFRMPGDRTWASRTAAAPLTTAALPRLGALIRASRNLTPALGNGFRNAWDSYVDKTRSTTIPPTMADTNK